ncbi:sodium-dependent nutrient amino acid transporter 1 isoform X1 [Folsomia candida]|uniref:sodium-dependent nutrient amino acid transporter 1 isoform X1 n=1 Tax=Folsomia candida TaxID=158441 RepID=UPI0016055509|nr:sodium-dependent nutrient amino acid transporter 1 isoform X1 [Folsomia candida]
MNTGRYKMKSDINVRMEHSPVDNNLVVVDKDEYYNKNTVEIPLDDLDERGNPDQTEQHPDAPASRQTWDRPVEFLLSCIAMSVGLGNIWRFPYIAFINGGGAFLIPYLIVLFVFGKPLYFLELSIGQFCSKGSCKVWQMSPFFKGIGYGAAFGSSCVLSFYVALMALTVFYFCQSFQSVLPWSVCNQDWHVDDLICVNNSALVNGTSLPIPELYFKNEVYHEKESIDDGIGNIDWRLAICLLASWIFIFISLIKGVESAGKVAYFTALFPYIVLFIFLIRGITLPGAWDGISYFISPQWGKLLELKVWIEAVKQCFFSMSIAFGPVITFASYNKFSHNIYKDAMIVSFMDTFTSLLAGFTTFSVLGNLAYQSGVDVKDVVKPGPGLAFVSFPQAIGNFPVPQFFSILFFLMLFSLGLGSATSLAGGLITVIHDKFTTIDKKLITIGVSIFGFSAGLIYVTPGGLWMLSLVDFFGAGSILYVIAILEMTGMIFVYGLPSIVRDIQFMLNRKISLYWQICWVCTPVILLVALIYDLATGESLKYNNEPYPKIAIICGWLLVVVALSMLPLFALHGIFQQKSEDGFINKLKQSFKPLDEWGPLNLADRLRWEEHKEVQARRPSLVGKFFIKH